MKIITSIEEMREFSRKAALAVKTIGFVPTMGCLHEGHMSLVKASVAECDITVLSVFVNPAQFARGEDLEKYPRDLKKDISMAEKESADVVFAPSASEMYPNGYTSYVEVEGAPAKGLCAASRPGHFSGVTTVVAKLFNIVLPQRAYFGQKDAQQAAVIKRMVKDLNFPVDIRIMPLVREKDGLAMSSRNLYLSPEERKNALRISGSLMQAEEKVRSGEVSAGRIKKEMEGILSGGGIKIDYIEVVDGETFEPIDKIKENTLIAVAAYVGSTRLIDNVVIRKVGSRK